MNKRDMRRTREYAYDFIEELLAGRVPAPGPGDCFHCYFRATGQRTTLGESTHSDHVMVHVEEKYYVPSLLQRALETYPPSRFALSAVASVWEGKECGLPEGGLLNLAAYQLRASLRKYVRSQWVEEE